MDKSKIHVLLIEDDEDDYFLTRETLREIADWLDKYLGPV